MYMWLATTSGFSSSSAVSGTVSYVLSPARQAFLKFFFFQWSYPFSFIAHLPESIHCKDLRYDYLGADPRTFYYYTLALDRCMLTRRCVLVNTQDSSIDNLMS